MVEDKKTFVKQFEALVKSTVLFSDIDRLDYYKDTNEESIYVTYRSSAQKVINVQCSSCGQMMIDFFNQLRDADWVINPKKFED